MLFLFYHKKKYFTAFFGKILRKFTDYFLQKSLMNRHFFKNKKAGYFYKISCFLQHVTILLLILCFFSQ